VLGRAFTSPITLGILIGFVVRQASGDRRRVRQARATRGRLRPPVGWARRGRQRDRRHPFTVVPRREPRVPGRQLENARSDGLPPGCLRRR
jgi:hypothetical protein